MRVKGHKAAIRELSSVIHYICSGGGGGGGGGGLSCTQTNIFAPNFARVVGHFLLVSEIFVFQKLPFSSGRAGEQHLGRVKGHEGQVTKGHEGQSSEGQGS